MIVDESNQSPSGWFSDHYASAFEAPGFLDSGEAILSCNSRVPCSWIDEFIPDALQFESRQGNAVATSTGLMHQIEKAITHPSAASDVFRRTRSH